MGEGGARWVERQAVSVGDEGPTCTPGKPNAAVWWPGDKKGCGMDSTWAVGTSGSKNGYGIYDMSGTVWE